MIRFCAIALLMTLPGCDEGLTPDTGRKWLAGDHHVHTKHSVEWDKTVDPPAAVPGGDAAYSVAKQAAMAQQYGLSWITVTDHGGPNHSRYLQEIAYPALVETRQKQPDLLLYQGLEMDVPGAKHVTVMMPCSSQEVDDLAEFERRFGMKDAWPKDRARDTESMMQAAMDYAHRMPRPPLIIVNHPASKATGLHEYTDNTPEKMRDWQDRAPSVVIGMEGAPGHQAAGQFNGERVRVRAEYDSGYPTMGGFDQMTAEVGGVWDALLGEGRRWWVTANSDSHVHQSDGGRDHWPGEYSKTWVFAEKTYDDIFDGLRAGRIFVATGDLIDRLDMIASTADGGTAAMGEVLKVEAGKTVSVTVRFRDPEGNNGGGHQPTVARVDLIVGRSDGTVGNTNPTARVAARFYPEDWALNGEWHSFTWQTKAAASGYYVRVRGTSTDELEPLADEPHEDPWGDLWFYSNPVFISQTSNGN